MSVAASPPPATATATPGPSAAIANAQNQFEQLVRESYVWVSQNALQILVASVVGTLIVLILWGLRGLGTRLCRDPAGTDYRTLAGKVIAKTSFWFIVILSVRLVVGYANVPPAVDRTIYFLFVVAFALQAAVWARELILGFVEHRAGPSSDRSSLGSALGIIRLLVSFALFALATILILDNLGVNVTGLIAGLGIGGIAIGLAAQGIFSDLFAALAIIFDKPFRRGDAIRWDTSQGNVEAIGLKTTRVRSITGEQIVISNANLLDKELHNMARLDRRRLTLAMGLVYATPPEVCARVPAMLKEIAESVEKVAVVRTGLVGFGDSSLDFELQFDVTSEVYNEVYDARTAVCLAILQRFTAEGIDFAFPTQVWMAAGPDGKAIMPYPPIALIHDEDKEVDGRTGVHP